MISLDGIFGIEFHDVGSLKRVFLFPRGELSRFGILERFGERFALRLFFFRRNLPFVRRALVFGSFPRILLSFGIIQFSLSLDFRSSIPSLFVVYTVQLLPSEGRFF